MKTKLLISLIFTSTPLFFTAPHKNFSRSHLATLTMPSPLLTSHRLIKSNTPENRVKIAVVDTGIILNGKTAPFLCRGNHYDLTRSGIEDNHGHGTNVAGIIANQINPQKACLLIIKYSNHESILTIDHELQGLNAALKEKAKYINFSSGGFYSYPEEKTLIKYILKQKIYFVTAAGNNNDNLDKSCDYYPACYGFATKYFRVVGNGKNVYSRDGLSNYGKVVTDWLNGMNVMGFGYTMSGTSQATAKLTGQIVKRNLP